MVLYVVRKGDTLVNIADRFGVSLTQLRRWNRISGVKVEPGRRLHVAEPSVAASSAPGHRRATAASAGEKAPQAAPGKASVRAPAAPSSKKRSAASSAGSRNSQKAHTSGTATRGAAASTRKKHANKQAAPRKSSAQ
jgi:membrane-bound lytic murein transglycosylase D